MNISATEAREAEHEARIQRLGLAYLLRANEDYAPSAADIMRIRRIMAAAAERSATYDNLLGECERQRLFSVGALFFTRPGEDPKRTADRCSIDTVR